MSQWVVMVDLACKILLEFQKPESAAIIMFSFTESVPKRLTKNSKYVSMYVSGKPFSVFEVGERRSIPKLKRDIQIVRSLISVNSDVIIYGTSECLADISISYTYLFSKEWRNFEGINRA